VKISAMMQQEDGVGRAVELIEQYGMNQKRIVSNFIQKCCYAKEFKKKCNLFHADSFLN
jgi:predicted XRE-type DNA-binding protein